MTEGSSGIPAPVLMFARSMLHDLRQQLLHRLAEQAFPRFAGDAFTADLEHDRDRQRRNVLQPNMPDSTHNALQETPYPADVEHPGSGIGPCSLEENMVRLVLAKHVVDEIG